MFPLVRPCGRPAVRTSGHPDVWTSGRPNVWSSGRLDVPTSHIQRSNICRQGRCRSMEQFWMLLMLLQRKCKITQNQLQRLHYALKCTLYNNIYCASGIRKGTLSAGTLPARPTAFFFETYRKPERTHLKTCADMIQTIFDRTDLGIRPSKAKFFEEADFKLRSAVASQKPCQISEKQSF